jgi:hypothetical protein
VRYLSIILNLKRCLFHATLPVLLVLAASTGWCDSKPLVDLSAAELP